MGENTSRIEEDIIAERTDLGRNLRELEHKAKALTDWQAHYRKHPGAFVGAAVGAGVVVGTLLAGRNGNREHDYYPVESPATPHERSRTLRRETERLTSQFRNTWDHIADALLGVAAAKAVQFMEGAVPGFREHYRGDVAPRYPRERT